MHYGAYEHEISPKITTQPAKQPSMSKLADLSVFTMNFSAILEWVIMQRRSTVWWCQQFIISKEKLNKYSKTPQFIDVVELRLGRTENKIRNCPLRGMCPSCLVIFPSKWIIPPAARGQILFMPLSLWIHLVETIGRVTVSSKSKLCFFFFLTVSCYYHQLIAWIHSMNIHGTVAQSKNHQTVPENFNDALLLVFIILLFIPGFWLILTI